MLDIGSGPGHDAAHLAGLGHRVVAAEPEPALLSGARSLYGTGRVTWVNDGLPSLSTISSLGLRYSFVLRSGVWMHLDAAERRDGMKRIASLLEPDGIVALSLRHGPVPAGRRMFQVGAEDTIALAAGSGLRSVLAVERDSIQMENRLAGVTWTFLAFGRAP